MRNIFLFISRHFNFLLFLFLQGMSIYFIVEYSKYHHAAFGNISNNVTGKINSRYFNIQQYFYLKKTNDSLLKANQELYNKLKSDYSLPDSSVKLVIDSIKVDSILQYRKFRYISAKVISNSVTSQSNFMVLSKGSSDNIKEGMGVVDPNNSVVGIVTEVNEKYAVVMSLLHKDSHISGKLLKGGETGTLNWDGDLPNIITLNGIPKSAKIAKGDSIISSGFSTAFPKGMKIGRVEAVYKETSTNYFRIKFRTTANFYNLQYVYVIENADQQAVHDILEKVKTQP
ncbi:MAG: rod shape-determining protein MreC [Bacteroidota bacterium]